MTNSINKEIKPDAGFAVITGASSGIGAATARLFSQKGYRVLLVARRVDRLTKLAASINAAGNGSAEVFAADLGQENEREKLFTRLELEPEGVDVLINNAGIGWYGYASEMPWKEAAEMLQVNIVATAQLTLLCLPGMRRRGRGHIINVGSVAGGFPNQGVAVYSATKSFQDAFTTSIFRELTGTGVHISVVRPGPVTTEFFTSAERRPHTHVLHLERFEITPEKVAEKIWGLVQHPRRAVYVPGILALAPHIELSFGWLVDLIGPLLLRRRPSEQ